jgi:hypothetical protein
MPPGGTFVLGRIRDIAHLLIFGYTSTERRCRELITDLTLLSEKLNMMLAREAKRQTRAAAKTAELLMSENPGSPASADRKRDLRRKAFGHLRPVSAVPQLLEEPSDESPDSEQ